MKQELDQGKEEQAHNEGQLKGYEFRKDEEQAKWLAEGHGPGMCISMQQHMLRMVKKAIILDQMEVQTESTETMDSSTQTTTTPECRITTQTEPLDDKGPTLTKNTKMALPANFGMQTTPSTNKTATQTKNLTQPPLPLAQPPNPSVKLPHPYHPHLLPTSTTAAPRQMPPLPQ